MHTELETPDTFRERVLERDGNRCTVARLFGGQCSPILHAHHIVPIREGGDHSTDNGGTACARHHPMWESLRVALVERRERTGWRRCRKHRHPYPQGREECERRLNRVAA